MNLDAVILTVQRFTRRWPDVRRFLGDTALAEGDTDAGFERLLRARLEEVGVPGDVALVGKVFDFIASPRFDTEADSIKLGFIGLIGFTEAARRILFAGGVIPFSRVGADVSLRFIDLQLAELKCQTASTPPG